MGNYVPGRAILAARIKAKSLEKVLPDETVIVQCLIEYAFGEFIAGHPSREDWETVASCLNMAEAIDTVVDKSVQRSVVYDAMGAMQEVGRCGLVPRVDHCDLIRKAVALHHAQLRDITRGQYEAAIQYAISMYRKKVFTYKVNDGRNETNPG